MLAVCSSTTKSLIVWRVFCLFLVYVPPVPCAALATAIIVSCALVPRFATQPAPSLALAPLRAGGAPG